MTVNIITSDTPEPRPVWPALKRGFYCLCPACGEGRVFRGYLKVRDHCPACGEALYHHRADDAPPYFTILIAGHVLVPLVVAVEAAFQPPLWLHMAIWLPLATAFCLALLRPVKGMVVAAQWATFMDGFDPRGGEPKPEPDPAGALRG